MDTDGRTGTVEEQYGVQMLRGIAAAAFVVHHALEVSNGASTRFSPDWLTTVGAAGVDIFFVISGFIMIYTSYRLGRSPVTPPLRELLVAPIPLEFVFGLWLGIAFRRVGSTRWRSVISPWLLLPAAILCAIAPLCVSHDSTSGLPGWPRIWAWGIPAALAVAAMLSVRTPQRMVHRALILLGDASYALYLTHAFVMIAYGFILRIAYIDGMPQFVVVPLFIVTAFVVGICAHLIVEKPVMQLIRQWTAREPVLGT